MGTQLVSLELGSQEYTPALNGLIASRLLKGTVNTEYTNSHLVHRATRKESCPFSLWDPGSRGLLSGEPAD